MGRVNHAVSERAAICDLLIELGPDQPTLCTGWQTRDLAAHLVMRDRRPLAGLGLVFRPLAGYTERVRRAYAARPFSGTVDALRRPPRWSPTQLGPLDRLVNTPEMFIHHEDIRRARPGWRPRDLPPDLARALWPWASGHAAIRLRRFPATVLVEAGEFGRRRAGRSGGDGDGDGATVRITGDPGELIMFFTGRQEAARVGLTGPEALTDRLARARLTW